MFGKYIAIQSSEFNLSCDLFRHRRVVERQAGIEQRLGRGAIGQAGIQMMEAVLVGDAA